MNIVVTKGRHYTPGKCYLCGESWAADAYIGMDRHYYTYCEACTNKLQGAAKDEADWINEVPEPEPEDD